MTAIVRTVAYLGLEARGVEVQVQLIAGLPAFKQGDAQSTHNRSVSMETSLPLARNR